MRRMLFALALGVAVTPAYGVFSITSVDPTLTSTVGPASGLLNVSGTDFLAVNAGEVVLSIGVFVSTPNFGEELSGDAINITNTSLQWPWQEFSSEGSTEVFLLKRIGNTPGGSQTRTETDFLTDALTIVQAPMVTTIRPTQVQTRGGQVLILHGAFSGIPFANGVTFTNAFLGTNVSGTVIGAFVQADPVITVRSELHVLTAPIVGLNPGSFSTLSVSVEAQGESDSGSTSYIGLASDVVRVAVEDATDSGPIGNARVFLERTDAALGIKAGFQGVNGFNEAVYAAALSDTIQYRATATAPGFLPASPIFVTAGAAQGSLPTLSLTPDSGLANANRLNVEIVLLDGNMDPTGVRLLTRTVTATRTSNLEEFSFEPFFARGENIVLGVPKGQFEVGVPDTAEYMFGTAVVELGTGVAKDVTLTATIVSTGSRAEVPGQIVGTVTNTGPGNPVAIDGAIVMSSQSTTNITAYTESVGGGTFFLPDIVPGAGSIQAFSPDGNIYGPAKIANVVSGQIYGDGGGEDTDLEIELPDDDVDGDGMSNDFEVLHFGNWIAGNPDGDPDGDGLTNLEEFIAGTDPRNADSDGDGFEDGVELLLASNPNQTGSTPEPPEPIWVDFGFTDALQVGTLVNPYATLESAAGAAVSGSTIRIKGDVDDVVGENPVQPIDKQVTVEAFNGPVRIE